MKCFLLIALSKSVEGRPLVRSALKPVLEPHRDSIFEVSPAGAESLGAQSTSRNHAITGYALAEISDSGVISQAPAPAATSASCTDSEKWLGDANWRGRCFALSACQALCNQNCVGFNWWPGRGGCRTYTSFAGVEPTPWVTVAGSGDCMPSDGYSHTPTDYEKCPDFSTPAPAPAPGPAPGPVPGPAAPALAPEPGPGPLTPAPRPLNHRWTSYSCGDTISQDCYTEHNNAKANHQMTNFCRRCATELGPQPLRSRCSLCCGSDCAGY